jgi:cytochrome c oxidase assembly protein subunit 15
MLDEGASRRDAAAANAPDVGRLAAPFALLVLLTWSLLVLGALVRAHGAGLACPDWPLCFGEFIPDMNLKVAFEWTHRVVAGGVSICFATLAVLLWRRTSTGDPLRRLLVIAAALLVVQIVLGALTVWKLLASWTVTSHLLVGNAIAASFVWTALALRDRRDDAPLPASPTPLARRWLAATLALLFVQMLLGGLVSSRYAGLACPEWPTCNGGAWFPSWRGPVGLHLLHRANGYLLLAALAGFVGLCRGTGRLSALSRLALAIALAQVAVGVANVLTGLPVEVTGVHSALAAALVLGGTAAAREVWGRP